MTKPIITAVRPTFRHITGVFSSKSFTPTSATDSIASRHKLIPKKEILPKIRTERSVQQLAQNNILGHGVTPQDIAPGTTSEFNGKLVTFNTDNPWKPQEVDPQDIAQSPQTILCCGLGGGESANKLYYSWYPIYQLCKDEQLSVYSSLMEGERKPERFRQGLPYYYNEFYINEEESENFFNAALKAKFFDENDRLKNPEDILPLTLIGFSIGYREIMSHISFLNKQISNALVREGKDPKEKQKFFDNIQLIGIGSPVNWNSKRLPDEILNNLAKGSMSPKEAEEYYAKHGSEERHQTTTPSIKTIHYRSIFDMGTAKPASDFYNFHCNAELLSIPRIYSFNRPGAHNEKLYLFGPHLVQDEPNGPKLEDGKRSNALGHNLSNYAQAIDSLRPRSLSSYYVSHQKYQEDREPLKEDWEALIRQWHSELLRRDSIKFMQDKAIENKQER